jgi:hypothetical protein
MSLWETWDESHPASRDGTGEDKGDFPESGDWEDLEDLPQLPTIDLLPPMVDYSSRAPGDFIVSGPLSVAHNIQGRTFKTHNDAFKWACGHYGTDRVSPVDAGELRWACLIKKV